VKLADSRRYGEPLLKIGIVRKSGLRLLAVLFKKTEFEVMLKGWHPLQAFFEFVIPVLSLK
jgi:hypothetical protein